MGAEGALCGRGWDQPRRPSCLGWQASERAPKIDHRSPLHSNLVTSRTIPESSRRARVGCANRRALRRCDATSEAPGDLPATAPVFTFSYGRLKTTIMHAWNSRGEYVGRGRPAGRQRDLWRGGSPPVRLPFSVNCCVGVSVPCSKSTSFCGPAPGMAPTCRSALG
jgi:hypothetical protein